MIIIHPKPEAAFRAKFPYPRRRLSYSPEEYTAMTRLSKQWYRLHFAIGVLFWGVFALVFMFFSQWLTTWYYSLMNRPNVIWFSQQEAPFMVPGLFIAFPLAVLTALKSIRLFRPEEYDKIIDLLNVKLKYDSIKSWNWFIKPMAVCCAIAWFIVSWSYVAVCDDGIAMKDPFSFKTSHIPYGNIKTIAHYKYYVDEGKVEPYDHYKVLFKNGATLFNLAPDVDDSKCTEAIIARSHIPLVEDSVDR